MYQEILLFTEPWFRKILWILHIGCIFYIAHKINPLAPITASLILLYIFLYRPKINRNLLFYLLTAFVIWLLVSIIANHELFFYHNFQTWLWLLEFYFIYLGFLILIKNFNGLYFVLKCFVIVTAIFAFFGYVELLFSPQMDWFFHWLRPSSPVHMYISNNNMRLLSLLNHYGYCGVLLSWGVILAFAFALNALVKNSNRQALWWFIVFGGELIALCFTYVRASILVAILGIIGVFVYWAYIYHRKFNYRRLAGLVIILVGAVMIIAINTSSFQILVERFVSIFKGDLSTHHRLILTWLGAQIMLDNPVFGVGLDNFKYVVLNTPAYLNIFPWILPGGGDENVSTSHNIFTEYGSIAGIPAALLITSILLYGVYLIYALSPKSRQNNREDIAVCLFGLLLSMVLMLPFEYALVLKPQGMAFFIIYALATKFQTLLCENAKK